MAQNSMPMIDCLEVVAIMLKDSYKLVRSLRPKMAGNRFACQGHGLCRVIMGPFRSESNLACTTTSLLL
eukprot:6196767-Pleurochrysis_carterae.AAC.2